MEVVGLAIQVVRTPLIIILLIMIQPITETAVAEIVVAVETEVVVEIDEIEEADDDDPSAKHWLQRTWSSRPACNPRVPQPESPILARLLE